MGLPNWRETAGSRRGTNDNPLAKCGKRKKFSMDWILKARWSAAAILLVTALLAAYANDDAAVKAPVLTFIGGAMVVTWFLPVRRPEWRDAVVVMGTGIATAGSWYWLTDATEGDPTTLVLSLIGGVALVVVSLVALLIWRALTLASNEPIDHNRREIERRVRRRLHEIVDETRQAGPRSAGSETYEAYDSTMLLLFLHTWSMTNAPHRWTYDPTHHRDLIGNYVVARLEKTAEIAISKHPHQCKYGAAAHNLASYARRSLRTNQLITEFDPLPTNCPECKEQKPTHQANCMAAVCWRCKYPTPPKNPDSQKTTVITPQCHIPMLCSPRGELVTPVEPTAVRIRLPFTVPQNGEDQSLTMGEWPRRKRDLRNLLGQLNHD